MRFLVPKKLGKVGKIVQKTLGKVENFAILANITALWRCDVDSLGSLKTKKKEGRISPSPFQERYE